MKRKLIAIALSLALLWVAAFSAAAQTESPDISIEPIVQAETDNTIMPLADTTIVDNNVYRIKNVGSGKYLNLHYGVDANSTNVYQWTYDGSTEQKWRVAYNAGTDSWQFYSMCSSGGTNRLLDISRGGAALASGQNVAIWTPTDTLSHEMQITAVATGKYKICMKGNTNLCLTAYGDSNGTADGRSSTSAGNVFISTYTGDGYQVWEFESTGETAIAPAGGFLDYVSSTGLGGWAWRSDLPNSPIDIHIYIDNLTTDQSWFDVTLANIYRGDLESAGYGNGCHGYSYSIDWENYPSGTYSVRTYAIGGGNPLLSGGPTEYTNVSNITTGTKQVWNHSSYQGSYAPKTGWARPTFYKEISGEQNYANTYCEFTLDSYNVTNILQYNQGKNPNDSKNLYLTLDISNIKNGTTDQMSAYCISTSLPDPKRDIENDDPLGNRNEESEITALGTVEPTTYNMSVMWYDYRNGGDNDDGKWQAQFAMSGQYIGVGNTWISSDGDYNSVYISSAIQATMSYGKNGGIE